MKGLIYINKIKRTVFLNNKGETILESIVSLLVFTILMIAVSTMIRTSLLITDSSTNGAQKMQEIANDAVLGRDSKSAQMYLKYRSGGEDFSITIPVKLSSGNGFTAFEPEED